MVREVRRARGASQQASGDASATARSEAIAQALIAAWNAHDVEEVGRLCAPEYQGVDVGAAEDARGPEGAGKALRRYLDAFPDLQVTLHQVVAQGDQVVLVWTARGTHRGGLMNIPATGRAVAVRGTSVLEVRRGKIARALNLWDVAGLLRALGLLPRL